MKKVMITVALTGGFHGKEGNAQLVSRTARIIKELDLEMATPTEAREILGLSPGKEVSGS